MRRLLILVLMPFAVAAQKGKPFTLNGDLQLKKPVEWVYIEYRDGENYVRDSVQPKNGRFSYQSNLAEPTLAEIQVVYFKSAGETQLSKESLSLFLEPGTTRLRIKDTITAQTVTGNPTHQEYLALITGQKPYRDEEKRLFEKYKMAVKENDTAIQKTLFAQKDSLEAEMLQKVNKPFLMNHPHSPVALMALTQIWGGVQDASLFEDLYNLLSPEVKALYNAVKFAEKIEIDKKIAIGKWAPDFSLADTAGRIVSLSHFKGKYVLVDFWASWCHPCRDENPNVVKVFNQYKDKGFTVLSVSLDDEDLRQQWLKAIADDGLTWTHVSDLKGWKNEAALQYGINAIPFNLLIDPQGKIIAKDLHGEELGQVIEKAVSGKFL